MTSDDPGAGRRLRRITAICVGLLSLQIALGVALPAGLGWDFANFYDAGARVAAGQASDLFDPQSAIAGRPPQGSMAFWSAPITAALYAPLSALAPETALVVFKLQNTLALLAAIALLWLFGRRFAGEGPLARQQFGTRLALACLAFQPLWTVYRVGGQTTPTVLLLLCIGLVCHVRARVALASLCFTVCVLIKPALVTGLLLLGLVSGARFAAWSALFLGLSGLVSVATLGWDVHAAFLSKLLGGAGAAYPWTFNSALTVPLSELRSWLLDRHGPGVASTGLELASLAVGLGVLVAVVGLVRASRRQDWSGAARRHFDFVLALLFFLWISRTVWEHYLALLFPFLVFCLANLERLSSGARGLLVAIFALCLGQNLVLALFLRDTIGVESAPALLAASLFKSAPLWLAFVLLLRHRAEIFAAHGVEQWRALDDAASPAER